MILLNYESRINKGIATMKDNGDCLRFADMLDEVDNIDVQMVSYGDGHASISFVSDLDSHEFLSSVCEVASDCFESPICVHYVRQENII